MERYVVRTLMQNSPETKMIRFQTKTPKEAAIFASDILREDETARKFVIVPSGEYYEFRPPLVD